METNQTELTNQLLRVVVALLLRQKGEQQVSLKEQIGMLDDLNLKAGEIAKIIGRSNSYVSKELVGIRRNRKK